MSTRTTRTRSARSTPHRSSSSSLYRASSLPISSLQNPSPSKPPTESELAEWESYAQFWHRAALKTKRAYDRMAQAFYFVLVLFIVYIGIVLYGISMTRGIGGAIGDMGMGEGGIMGGNREAGSGSIVDQCVGMMKDGYTGVKDSMTGTFKDVVGDVHDGFEHAYEKGEEEFGRGKDKLRSVKQDFKSRAGNPFKSSPHSTSSPSEYQSFLSSVSSGTHPLPHHLPLSHPSLLHRLPEPYDFLTYAHLGFFFKDPYTALNIDKDAFLNSDNSETNIELLREYKKRLLDWPWGLEGGKECNEKGDQAAEEVSRVGKAIRIIWERRVQELEREVREGEGGIKERFKAKAEGVRREIVDGVRYWWNSLFPGPVEGRVEEE